MWPRWREAARASLGRGCPARAARCAPAALRVRRAPAPGGPAAASAARLAAPALRLRPLEREVLWLAAGERLPNDAIARRLGITAGQGYLLGRPVAEPEFETYAIERSCS